MSQAAHRPQSIATQPGPAPGIPVADLLRRHAVSKATFFEWRGKYAGATVNDVKRRRLVPAGADRGISGGTCVASHIDCARFVRKTGRAGRPHAFPCRVPSTPRNALYAFASFVTGSHLASPGEERHGFPNDTHWRSPAHSRVSCLRFGWPGDPPRYPLFPVLFLSTVRARVANRPDRGR